MAEKIGSRLEESQWRRKSAVARKDRSGGGDQQRLSGTQWRENDVLEEGGEVHTTSDILSGS